MVRASKSGAGTSGRAGNSVGQSVRCSWSRCRGSRYWQVVQQLLRSNVVELVPVTVAVAKRAAAIAADHRLRGCDAVYVALAEQSGDHLVTLDQQQLERGTAVVTVCKP